MWKTLVKWSRNCYSAENWTLWKLYKKYHKIPEMWSWRKTEKIIGTGHVKNYGVLHTVKEQWKVLHRIKKKLTGLATFA